LGAILFPRWLYHRGNSKIQTKILHSWLKFLQRHCHRGNWILELADRRFQWLLSLIIIGFSLWIRVQVGLIDEKFRCQRKSCDISPWIGQYCGEMSLLTKALSLCIIFLITFSYIIFLVFVNNIRQVSFFLLIFQPSTLL
jgi:hypothetical protein